MQIIQFMFSYDVEMTVKTFIHNEFLTCAQR